MCKRVRHEPMLEKNKKEPPCFSRIHIQVQLFFSHTHTSTTILTATTTTILTTTTTTTTTTTMELFSSWSHSLASFGSFLETWNQTINNNNNNNWWWAMTALLLIFWPVLLSFVMFFVTAGTWELYKRRMPCINLV